MSRAQWWDRERKAQALARAIRDAQRRPLVPRNPGRLEVERLRRPV